MDIFSKNCQKNYLQILELMTIFGNFYEKNVNFWRFFAIQMSILWRVRSQLKCHPTLPELHQCEYVVQQVSRNHGQ